MPPVCLSLENPLGSCKVLWPLLDLTAGCSTGPAIAAAQGREAEASSSEHKICLWQACSSVELGHFRVRICTVNILYRSASGEPNRGTEARARTSQGWAMAILHLGPKLSSTSCPITLPGSPPGRTHSKWSRHQNVPIPFSLIINTLPYHYSQGLGHPFCPTFST